MTIISASDFAQQLNGLPGGPGSLTPLTGPNGSTLAPTDSGPFPTTPTSAPGRPIPAGRPFDLGAISVGIDTACNLRRINPFRYRDRLRGIQNSIPGAGFFQGIDNALDNFCNLSGVPQPPLPDAPVNGGQCDGIKYLVDVVWEVPTTDPICNYTQQPPRLDVPLWGPIQAARIGRPLGPGTAREVEVLCRGRSDQPIRPLDWYRVASAGGTTNCPEDGQIISVFASPAVPGQDVCGDRPIDERDTGRIIPTGPPTFNFPINGNNVPVTINMGFNPQLGITMNLPELGIDLSFDGGNFDIDFGAGNSGPGRDGQDGEAGGTRPSPGDTEPGDDPPPPPEEDVPPEEPNDPEAPVIRAVLVTVDVEPPDQGKLFQQGNPNIGIPRYGYVSFRCRISDTASGWTDDIPVKNRRHIIPCPYDGGAIAVAGTPNLGVEWTLTPIVDATTPEEP